MWWKNTYNCYDPTREDVRWVGTTEQVSNMLILELKSMKIYVKSPKKFHEMVRAIAARYDEGLPFHNFRHAVHVTLMMLWFMKHFIQSCGPDHFHTEYFSLAKFVIQMVVITLCHDMDHHGHNNETQNSANLKGFDNIENIDFEKTFILSLTSYNETRHVTNAIDIFNTYGTSIWKYDIRDNLLIHNCIMSTDMQFHKRISNHIQSILKNKSSRASFIDNRVLMGMFMLKCADMGHFMCSVTIHLHWVMNLESEFNMKNTVDSLNNQFTRNEPFIDIIQDKTSSFLIEYVKPNMRGLTDMLKIDSRMLLHNIDFWNHLKHNIRVSEESRDSYIERMSINKPMLGHRVEEHEDVCICMIDIVNFTKWSSDKRAERVFTTMSNFNQFVLKLINKRHDVEKIEMVGDSMMVIGGLENGCDDVVKCEMFHFVSDLLCEIQTLKDIFCDDSVSIRVGMHIGNIHIGIIKGPRRIQVFGNAICIASRMESIAYPGTLMVTHTLFNCNHMKSNMIDGKELTMSVKGIGDIQCKCLFLTNPSINILVGDDLQISTRIISAKIHTFSKSIGMNVKVTEENNIRSLVETMYSNQYDYVFLDWQYQYCEKIDTLLHDYKVFENIYRNKVSEIVVYSTSFEELLQSETISTLVEKDNLVNRKNILSHVENILNRHASDLKKN